MTRSGRLFEPHHLKVQCELGQRVIEVGGVANGVACACEPTHGDTDEETSRLSPACIICACICHAEASTTAECCSLVLALSCTARLATRLLQLCHIIGLPSHHRKPEKLCMSDGPS
eukprot:jgi/Ulvmu1/3711/UM170_0017.1